MDAFLLCKQQLMDVCARTNPPNADVMRLAREVEEMGEQVSGIRGTRGD